MKRIPQIIYNTGKGFYDDGCSTRAAALTYFTLMSIVPVLAVAFGLAKGFGFANVLEEAIKQQFHEQPEVSKYMIDFAYSLLEKTTSGVIAGIGLIVLLWSVYNILGNIEEALNVIWKVPNPRSWIRKVTDYITTMIVCPIFFVISSSFTIYLKTNITGVTRGFAFLETGFFQLLPYFVIWLLFAFLYFFIPNRRIPFRYGILGAIVAGTAYQLLQMFYIAIQLKLSSYSAVYGSFAALPLFLIWLNLSWMIILAGAELAYHAEITAWSDVPRKAHLEETHTSTRVLALMTTYEIIQAFCNNKEPLTIHELSEKFGVSKKFLDDVIKVLIKQKILSEVHIESEDSHYQPARDINAIYFKTVVDSFPPTQEQIPAYKNSSLTSFENALSIYEKESSGLASNKLLAEFVL